MAVEYNNGMVHFFNQRHPKFLILDIMNCDLVQIEFNTSSPTRITLFSPGGGGGGGGGGERLRL